MLHNRQTRIVSFRRPEHPPHHNPLMCLPMVQHRRCQTRIGLL
jgi:hypothetical protein